MRLFYQIYNYYISPDKELAHKLKPILGFKPAKLKTFKLAFAHKSNAANKGEGIQNNERLEYLGDAVLGTIVAEYLFKKYPKADEGFLTKMRSKIVKRTSLNQIGEKMELDIILSAYNHTHISRSMQGNAVEALVGAVYLELGYKRTKRYVIRKILRRYVDVHKLEKIDDNYKSRLLEYCQKNGQSVNYRLMSRYKYEKRDRFKVGVFVNNEKLATADDYNKKSAEQMASEKALRKLGVLKTETVPS